MSTHGPQHDEFGTQRSDTHGGQTFDEGFNSFAAAHSNAHGKLFDKFSQRPGVDRYGERWDEFPWKELPTLHGSYYDEGFDAPSFDDPEHGRLHDVFRGTRVRYMYGGQDVEGVVLDTQKDFAVVESREGDRHEVTLGQLLAYATAQGNPHDGAIKEASPATVDTSVVATKPSAPANGGERVTGGSYDDSVVTHVKSFGEALEVVKTLAPFDEAVFDADVADFADVAKSFPGVSHLSTAKLSEAHAKFSDHYTAARLTGNHDRAHFAAQVLASTHAELHTRGVMAEKPDEGEHPTTRGATAGHAPLRKDATGDVDVAKAIHFIGSGAKFPTSCHGCGAKMTPETRNHTTTNPASGKVGHGNTTTATCNRCGDYHQGLTKPGTSQKPTPPSVKRAADKQNWPESHKSVGKSVDADETATQPQDLDSGQGANWCKHCQHYCRKVVQGTCPTCGGPVGVKKNWAEALDVLKETANAA